MVRFQLPDGTALVFDDDLPDGPRCRAMTRARHRCRNLVLTAQPGPYVDAGDDVATLAVEHPDDADQIRTQLCRVHLDSAAVLYRFEGRAAR